MFTDHFVSCIMPTYNRREFVARALRYFLRQDYTNRELIVVDDGTDVVADLMPADPRIRYLRLTQREPLGAKRNLACQAAHGDVIIHWDDDDWHASWRVSYQAVALLKSQADICGLTDLYFYDPSAERAWQYCYPPQRQVWMHGGTLCYTKTFWETNPFPTINRGQDIRFLWSKQPKKLVALQNCNFYIAIIHAHNISPKRPHPPVWRPCSPEKIQQLMGEEWSLYHL